MAKAKGSSSAQKISFGKRKKGKAKKEGRMSQHNFMRSVRMSLPQYITNVTSFNDTVKILKNKGILNEATIGIDPIESALKSYLAKGYSYSEAIRAVAAEEEIDEETLSFQYPQDMVDIEGYEADDEDAELEDMIARAEDELSPEKYKFDDFEGGLSEAKEIKIGEKIVKDFKQNGDNSYSVEFEDGSKRTIAVSNDDWDIIKAATEEKLNEYEHTYRQTPTRIKNGY